MQLYTNECYNFKIYIKILPKFIWGPGVPQSRWDFFTGAGIRAIQLHFAVMMILKKVRAASAGKDLSSRAFLLRRPTPQGNEGEET